MKKANYRGIRPASVITVLEGEGTNNSPYEEVHYVVVIEEVCGIPRPITLGKVPKIEI